MHVAIRFDDDAAFEADEIGNKGSDWVLPAKPMANDLTVAQNLPKGFLGFGLMRSQMARLLVRHFGTTARPVDTPPPPPPPHPSPGSSRSLASGEVGEGG